MASKKKDSAASSLRFFGSPLPGIEPGDCPGKLIVLEGTDGSGRSTQIALLTEWLESQGFAVQTMGLRRSLLLADNIDDLIAHNVITRTTLALMYATDFYDSLENVIIPGMRAGSVLLADRYVYTLIARAVVRGLDRAFVEKIYEHALVPDLTFRLELSPQIAFEREFRKAQAISYWESGRDMNLSPDLFDSFIKYQTMVKTQFDRMAKRYEFVNVAADASIAQVNLQLRRRIASLLGIRGTAFRPSGALAHLLR
ncbi:MAG: thymidylate kinase [Deltaproteobacteria bacterium]|nr:thymidylate kinase [Deltaproteobacteria bacterium]